MNWRSTPDLYASLSIGLNWLMLLLFAAVYARIESHEFFPKGSDLREALKTWHFMLGLSVLVLVALRLAAHVIGPVPLARLDAARWQAKLARLMHFALYLFMILRLGRLDRVDSPDIGVFCGLFRNPAFDRAKDATSP